MQEGTGWAQMSVPDALTERIDKAGGHINAIDRYLWRETERGLWSGHQAVARLAEAWFLLRGLVAELPLVEKYLPREVMQERLDDFQRLIMGTILADRLEEVGAAEAAILAEPFPNPPDEDRAALTAGLARQYRYLDALRSLSKTVEDEIADRYITLQPGDWVRLPDGHIGHLIERPGLSGWFFVPDIAMNNPGDARKGWRLPNPRIQRVESGPDMPIAAPAYYWLLAAHRGRQGAARLAETDWAMISSLCATLNAALDAAAKAWLTMVDLGNRSVSWEHPYVKQHISRFAEVAPAALAAPLQEAVDRIDALSLAFINNWRRSPPGWREEVTDIFRLVRDGITGLEEALADQVELAPGQWVDVLPLGPGRLVHRQGTRLVIDRGPYGVAVVSLFQRMLHPRAAPTAPAMPTESYHARWLWFACHPDACQRRAICPCCGYPGVPEGSAAGTACLLCGWIDDGGDLDPLWRNPANGGIDLALARQRFEALGYGTVPTSLSSEQAAIWQDPLILAIKRRLTLALARLVGGGAVDGVALAGIETLWHGYRTALRRCGWEGVWPDEPSVET